MNLTSAMLKANSAPPQKEARNCQQEFGDDLDVQLPAKKGKDGPEDPPLFLTPDSWTSPQA